jgi:hypothetical protein
MEKKSLNQQIVEDDILRYKRNKLAATLALIGLALNCLYFCLLYAIPDINMRTIVLGFSILLTLIVLLVTFLSSEGVKGYKKSYSIVLLVIAAFQIAKIFYYPLNGLVNDTLKGIGYFGFYPESSVPFFIILVIYLAGSAGCLIASAVLGWIYSTRLEHFTKKVESGEINVEAAMSELEKEEAQNAQKSEIKPSTTGEEVK